jgi:hypothetical protein
MDDIISHLHHTKWIRTRGLAYLNGGFRQPAGAPILMDAGYQGLDWQVDEYSRARAAMGLAATVQSRMAGANVAREVERAMGLDAED